MAPSRFNTCQTCFTRGSGSDQPTTCLLQAQGPSYLCTSRVGGRYDGGRRQEVGSREGREGRVVGELELVSHSPPSCPSSPSSSSSCSSSTYYLLPPPLTFTHFTDQLTSPANHIPLTKTPHTNLAISHGLPQECCRPVQRKQRTAAGPFQPARRHG